MNSPSYHIVIPARYASSRLPGKVLLELSGHTMLQHVWQRAVDSLADSVVIAADDQRIVKVAEAFGADVLMTATEHKSGSDRIAECAQILGWEDDQLVVNLQADEPLLPPPCLDQLAALLAESSDCEVASLYCPLTDTGDVTDPNVVKVITAPDGHALYFSRAPIPFARGHADIAAAAEAGMSWKRHIGLYAYRVSALRRFTSMLPTPLETSECLEQLRILEYGGRIAMAPACQYIPAGIDTSEDLDRVRDKLNLTYKNSTVI